MIKLHSLVLYKNQVAVVTGFLDGKISIEYCTVLPSRNKGAVFTNQKVREKDIALLFDGMSVQKSQLPELIQLNLNENDAVQIITPLYELISLDEEFQKGISFEELCSFAGFTTVYDCYKLFVALQMTPHFEKISQDKLIYHPLSEQQIISLNEKNIAKNKEQEERQAFIKRLKQKKLLIPDDIQQMQDVEALALGKTDKSRTLKEAGYKETQEIAHKLLLETKIWSIQKNPHPSRFALSMKSSTECLANPPNEERVFLNHISYAIDNSWSNDPDDAIAFDGEFVWVHVADPASSVIPDSPIDISARNRGSTLYIPEGAARMLAEESLSEYALGLSEQSKALSFKIKLDESGAITDCHVIKSIVKVKRLTYEQADIEKESPELKPLFDIAEKNRTRRNNAKAVSITLPEVHISVHEGKVTIEPLCKTESQSLVQEFMLLAGEAAAKYAFKNNIPFPFISQEKPDIPNKLPEGLAGQYRLRKSMRSRSVGVTPMQHAGLGLSMYSQVTSPLRRYGDLVAHQQLRAFIDKRTLLDKDKVLERIAAGDAASSAASKAERQSRMHWTLVYLLQNPEWYGEAIIVEIKNKQAICFIPAIGIETSLISTKNLQLNQSLTVKAGNINIPNLSVTFIEI